jgi:hypothetical protein
MRYTYNRGSLPPVGAQLLQQINDAAGRLAGKLRKVNPSKLSLSEHGQESIAIFRERMDETFKKYVHLLAWATYPALNGGHAALVDYGGGHGLMACLAKEAGFRRVIYNDIFEGCCTDARKLAEHLGCAADEYVCGSIQAVRDSMNGSRPESAAVVSINVIEHIYDMDEFIRVAGAISDGPMTMVLSTSANPLNPAVARRHYNQHRLWEFHDGPHESSYPMDTMRAFRSVRREIVKATAPELTEHEVETLADATRGMWKPDIEQCVGSFLATRKFPSMPVHPTNTCDPLTGSWQERLLDIPEVSQTLAESGFKVRVMGGYYSGHARNPLIGKVKLTAAAVLNHAISFLGTSGARLAPAIIFHGARR